MSEDKSEEFNMEEFLKEQRKQAQFKKDGFLVDPEKGVITVAMGERSKLTFYHDKDRAYKGMEVSYNLLF